MYLRYICSFHSMTVRIQVWMSVWTRTFVRNGVLIGSYYSNQHDSWTNSPNKFWIFVVLHIVSGIGHPIIFCVKFTFWCNQVSHTISYHNKHKLLHSIKIYNYCKNILFFWFICLEFVIHYCLFITQKRA